MSRLISAEVISTGDDRMSEDGPAVAVGASAMCPSGPCQERCATEGVCRAGEAELMREGRGGRLMNSRAASLEIVQ